MSKGLDYSWSRIPAADLKAMGFEFVMRYVPYRGDGGKGLTTAEVADFHGADLGIGLVFESTGSRHLDGAAAGNADANTVQAALVDLGAPLDMPIFFGVDFDATLDQMAAIDQYQYGVISVLGLARTGVYGSYAVVKHCHDFGTATWFWQTYAWSSIRGVVQNYPNRHVFQYSNGEMINGQEVDFCEAYTDEFLWRNDMGMTAQEKDDFAALVADNKRLANRVYQLETQAWGENPVTPRGTPEAPYYDSTFRTVDEMAEHAGAVVEPSTGRFVIEGTITRQQ